jgi:hypothetical protein
LQIVAKRQFILSLNRIYQFLKANGFWPNTSKTLCRNQKDTIDAITFSSFSTYFANCLDCTTSSLSVELNVLCPFIYDSAPALPNGKLYKPELHGAIRYCLKKDIRDECPSPIIWYVHDDGSNIDEVVDSVERSIKVQALPWFERFSDLAELLRTLQEEPQKDASTGNFGYGNPDSPLVHYISGFIALRLGDLRLAKRSLDQLLQGKSEELKFPIVYDTLKSLQHVEL